MPAKAPAAKVYESWDEIDRALARLGRIEPEAEQEKGKLKVLIQETKNEFEPRIKRLDDEIEAIREGMIAFVNANKRDLGDARSISLKHGSIGLRLSPPKLVMLGTKTTWDKVIELMADLPAALLKRFIRYTAAADKDAIKDAIEDGSLDDATRRSIKVDLIQEEKVVYDLASESAVRS